jgi:hypothetical protein
LAVYRGRGGLFPHVGTECTLYTVVYIPDVYIWLTPLELQESSRQLQPNVATPHALLLVQGT